MSRSPAPSSAGPSCPPKLKWQWADRGWIHGQDRVNFVLGLNQGTVKDWHEQQGELNRKQMRILGAPEIVQLMPKRDKQATWTGSEEEMSGSKRRSRGFTHSSEKAARKPTATGRESSSEDEATKRRFQKTPFPRRKKAGAPDLGSLQGSSSLPSLLPPNTAEGLPEDSQFINTAGESLMGTTTMSAETGPSAARVSFQIPPPTPSLPPVSSRASSEKAESEKSGVKVMAAPGVMQLYNGLKDWSPKWAPQPLSIVRYRRGPIAPPRETELPENETTESLQARLAELKKSHKAAQIPCPKPIKLEHQSSLRNTAWDFSGCIRNPNPKTPTAG